MRDFKSERVARLSSKADIERAVKRGERCRVGFFSVRWIERQGGVAEEPSRFCVAIGRQQAKRAVDRNRLKRLVREFVRLNRRSIRKGLDVAILANRFKYMSYKELESEMKELFRRAGLTC